jgi:hypothetical protein
MVLRLTLVLRVLRSCTDEPDVLCMLYLQREIERGQ